MKKFFKYVDEFGYTHFAATLPNFEGMRITIGNNNYSSVDNLYSHKDGGYTEITEEEFTQAFDTAIAMIGRNMLVAA
jgi:hypothetical protein